MAKGYPDFFGFSMFPYYGSMLDDMNIGQLSAGEVDNVTQITGKNHIFGGHCLIFNVEDLVDLFVTIIVDSVTVQHSIYNPRDPLSSMYNPFTILTFTGASRELQTLALRFDGGFTVASEFIIQLENRSAYNMNGAGNLFYSPIAT